VSRCWTYETAIALNTEISNDLPYSDYFDYFTPEEKLHIKPEENMPNKNTDKYLQNIVISCHEKLRMIEPVPSVQVQERAPDAIDMVDMNEFLAERINPDFRQSLFEQDQRIVPDNEFY
jgi:histone deacetylase 1/2